MGGRKILRNRRGWREIRSQDRRLRRETGSFQNIHEMAEVKKRRYGVV